MLWQGFMRNTTYIPWFKGLFLSTGFLMLLMGCGTNEDGKTTTIQERKKDSILEWVKNSRNTSISKAEREQWLTQAYDAAIDSQNDSLKSRYFSRISLSYLKLEDSTGFRRTNKIAMDLSKRIGDSISHAETHWDLGIFFRGNSVQDSAYYHYQEAQKIYSKTNNDFFSARLLYNMALVQASVKDYTGSEITTIRAIELLKPLDKYIQLYNCYNNLGSISNELNEYEKAIEYYTKALEYQDKINQKNNLRPVTINNIGVVHLEQGQYAKAKGFFEEVLQYDSLFYKETRLYGKAINNLAYSKMQLGEETELPMLFEKAIQTQDSINDLFGISRSYYGLTEYYLDNKDTVSALRNAISTKEYAKESSNNKRLLEILKLFPRLDPKNAAAYTQEYIALNDSLQMEERKTRNKFARIRFETDEFIAQNQLLAQQRQLWIGIALGLVLLAGSIFIIIYQRIKNQRLKFEQQQQQSNQEIFDLMLTQKKKVEEGKQQEQKRISEELHDGILGQMNGIRMMLLGLNKKTDQAAVDQRLEVIGKLQNVQEEVRTISHELNYASYQKIHNFINSIQDLIRSIADAAQMTYTFDYDEELDWDELNGDLKINIYRVVQESLQNCVKHAKAKTLSLQFRAEKKLLKVEIADDGAGFDLRKGKRGIGLKNITSRVHKLQGTWGIKSKIGTGTTVTVLVPFNREQEIPEAPEKQQPALEKA